MAVVDPGAADVASNATPSSTSRHQQQQQQQHHEAGVLHPTTPRNNHHPTAASSTTTATPASSSSSWLYRFHHDSVDGASRILSTPPPTAVANAAATTTTISSHNSSSQYRESIRICLDNEEFLLTPSVQPYFQQLLSSVPTAAAEEEEEEENGQSEAYRPRISSYATSYSTHLNDDIDNDNDQNEDDDADEHNNANNHHHLHHAALLSRHYYYNLNNSDDRRPPLNGFNLLNVLAFLIQVIIWYGVGVWRLDGLLPSSIYHMFQQQQDSLLLVPLPWMISYLMWIPILISEALFVVAQVLPDVRARPMIPQGISYYFATTCFLQATWTIFFALQWFVGSFGVMVATCMTLACLLASQYLLQVREYGGGGGNGGGYRPYHHNKSNLYETFLEYGLFQMPFLLHLGWTMVMSTIQLSLLVQRLYNNDNNNTNSNNNNMESMPLAMDMFVLALWLAVATYFLTGGYPAGPDFCVPLVVLTSYVGIAIRLMHPSDTLVETYGELAISAVRYASYGLAGTVGMLMVPGAVIWIAHECCTIQVVELADDSFADDPLLTRHLS